MMIIKITKMMMVMMMKIIIIIIIIIINSLFQPGDFSAGSTTGHTKTTLHARCINKSRKIIAFSHLNSTNFNDNFEDNFMREKVNSTLVALILSFPSFVFFRHLYVWELLKLFFDDFFHIAFSYTIKLNHWIISQK